MLYFYMLYVFIVYLNNTLTSYKGFEENYIKVIRTLLFPMKNSNELSVLMYTQSLGTQK